MFGKKKRGSDFEEYQGFASGEGYERLFLWTDCECNWKWYEDHGFELLQKEEYPPFSSQDEAYMTYIFMLTLR